MRKQDVKTGVVYAYKRSKYDKPRKVVVVDTAHLYWMTPRQTYGGPKTGPTFSVARTGVGFSDTTGYLGIFGDDGHATWGAGERQQADSRILASVTRERLLAMRFGVEGKSSDTLIVGDIRCKVAVINPRFIAGEWDDVMQAKDDEDERRRLIEADLKRQSDARVAATKERVDRLAKLGLPGHLPDPHEPASRPWRTGNDWDPLRYDQSLTGKVSLTLGQLDALLSLIPEGAVYVDPDEQTEDDGWTLARPPGQPSTTP